MKKLLLLIVAVVLCFSLVACGKKDDQDINNNLGDQSGDVQNNEENSGDEEGSLGNLDIKVESTDDRYVLTIAGQYKMIFEFENDVVSAYYLEYEFPTEEEAIAAESNYNAEDAEEAGIKSVVREGNVIRVEANLDEYEGLTRAQVEESFGALVQ